MFDLVRMFGTPAERLPLATRRSRPIENLILPEQPQHQQAEYHRQLRRRFEAWQPRRPAYGTCNCFGMIFANRRTAVFDCSDPAVMQSILDDDGFRLLDASGQVAPGDLVMYRSARDGYVHAALVYRVNLQGVVPLVQAISKWGPYTGEDFHNVYQHPFADDGDSILVEFWTDRPAVVA